MKIYLAHPITGLSGKEVFAYYNKEKDKFKHLYTILCPMATKEYLLDEKDLKAVGYTNPVSTDHGIYQRDTWMVDQADIVYVDFTGSKRISIGCCMELAIASHLHKHTVIAIENDNVHNHAFVREAADTIFETAEQAEEYLVDLAESMI